MRMCVIAQTPLISPFGSIGFREREARGRKDGGRGERLPGTQGEDEKRKIFFKSMRLQPKHYILFYTSVSLLEIPIGVSI